MRELYIVPGENGRIWGKAKSWTLQNKKCYI
jgi:hypothetical protein